MYRRLIGITSFLAALSLPSLASAHEFYILNDAQIASGLTQPPFSLLAVAFSHADELLFWMFVGAFALFCIFSISLVRPLERRLDPLLLRLKNYAPALARISLGAAFLAASYYQATFGPELPLAPNFGGFAPLISLLLAIVGTLIIVGFWGRAAAIVAIVIYGITLYQHGWYMFTYFNYFGGMLVLLLLGSHRLSVHSLTGWGEQFHHLYHRFADRIRHLSFPMLRVAFGTSLVYAAFYGKIQHDALALQVVSLPFNGHAFGLAHYAGLDPHLLVLIGAIMEITIGLFFILGIEIRFTALFFLCWLSLTIWWFGEVFWPHIIMYGIPIAFIMHGYDKYSLEGRFFKSGMREPVL